MEAIIGALGAIVGAIIAGLFLRKKNDADATEVITKIALNLIEPLDKKIMTLEKKNERYLKRLVVLMGGIEVLIKQLVDNRIVPCWTPDDWSSDDD